MFFFPSSSSSTWIVWIKVVPSGYVVSKARKIRYTEVAPASKNLFFNTSFTKFRNQKLDLVRLSIYFCGISIWTKSNTIHGLSSIDFNSLCHKPLRLNSSRTCQAVFFMWEDFNHDEVQGYDQMHKIVTQCLYTIISLKWLKYILYQLSAQNGRLTNDEPALLRFQTLKASE